MKKNIYMIYFLFLSLLTGCSNMTIGFEENSIFYTKPQKELVPRQEKKALKPEVKTSKIELVAKKEKIASKPEEKISKIELAHEKEVIHPKAEDKKLIIEEEVKDNDTENETSFSYDRYEGE